MSVKVGVLALQGDVREHLESLEASGVEAISVRRERELEQIDGLVIPGGESTAISKLLGIFDMFEPIQARLKDGMPAFGSCAGMILLASEVLDTRADAVNFGAIDMTVRRNAFGRQVDSFEQDLEFVGLESPVRAVFIRAPWVERVGSDVEVLARDNSGHIVAVRHGNVMATAFHPEVTSDHRVHGLFARLVQTA
ncbi:MAG: pyridoxal 5'-phosphate synthase glutaminase subunit PdxT [Nocardiaceae bacterium]|nr:pyridoxal 5'-phosphate synthase glutaminase subunit PdxT [Nocardiaceae bacterium]